MQSVYFRTGVTDVLARFADDADAPVGKGRRMRTRCIMPSTELAGGSYAGDIFVHDTRDDRARNGYLGNRRGEGGPAAAHAFTQPASSRQSWRLHRMPGRLAGAGRCRPAPAAAYPARAAEAAGVSRSSSWSSAGAVARKARSTSRRAGCCDRAAAAGCLMCATASGVRKSRVECLYVISRVLGPTTPIALGDTHVDLGQVLWHSDH